MLAVSFVIKHVYSLERINHLKALGWKLQFFKCSRRVAKLLLPVSLLHCMLDYQNKIICGVITLTPYYPRPLWKYQWLSNIFLMRSDMAWNDDSHWFSQAKFSSEVLAGYSNSPLKVNSPSMNRIGLALLLCPVVRTCLLVFSAAFCGSGGCACIKYSNYFFLVADCNFCSRHAVI